MKKLFLILCIATACTELEDESQKSKEYIVINDFESFAGWIPANNSLTTEQAHSGKYSIKVDKGLEYSMGFGSLLGKVSSQKPHTVRLSYYAYLLSGKSTAHYQLQILDPVTGQKVYEDDTMLTDDVKDYRRWVKVEKTIRLPETIVYTHEIRTFLWGPNASEPTYVDDISLLIVE